MDWGIALILVGGGLQCGWRCHSCCGHHTDSQSLRTRAGELVDQDLAVRVSCG